MTDDFAACVQIESKHFTHTIGHMLQVATYSLRASAARESELN